MRRKRANCVYISKTRQSAKDIIWKVLKDILRDHSIKTKINETYLTIDFHKSESTIRIYGADTLKDIEKRRGQKYSLAIIDEVNLFPHTHIRALVEDILSIALADQQGSLVCTGTPEPSCASWFYEKDHTDGFEKHHWTWRENKFFTESALRENPSLYDIEDIMLEDLKLKNQKVSDPSVRREWFGEWVRSDDLMVYKYNERLCHYDELPTGLTHYVMGVDLGFDDYDAVTIVGFCLSKRETYVVDVWKKNKLTLSDLASKLQQFVEKYRPFVRVCDTGGLGKKLTEELNARWNLGLIPAEKERKFEFISICNSELEQGYIKIKRDSVLADEMKLLTKDEEKYRMGILKEDDRHDNHATDSFIYAFRYTHSYRAKLPQLPKKPEEELADKIRRERDAVINRKPKSESSFDEPPSRVGKNLPYGELF